MKLIQALAIGAAFVAPGLCSTGQTLAATEKAPPLSGVLRAGLESLSLSRTRVLGGFPVMADVHLSGPAGPSGTLVFLSTNDPIAAAVPNYVAIHSGKSLAYFKISTAHVQMAHVVTITATLGTTSKSTQLTVTP